jgi:hypothetical protein
MDSSIIKFIDNKKLGFNHMLLKPFFSNLKLDYNDKTLYNIKPFRARKILYLIYENNEFKIYKTKKSFSQNVKDKRCNSRKFTILKPNKKQQRILFSFLKKFLHNINSDTRILDKTLLITVHFVKIITGKEGQTNSPEGVHRDGFDILMPCYVIERKNIKGGISRFFINNKCFLRKQIKEGQGLFLYENTHKNVFHDVTPIYSKGNKGYRCIVGIDINFK